MTLSLRSLRWLALAGLLLSLLLLLGERNLAADRAGAEVALREGPVPQPELSWPVDARLSIHNTAGTISDMRFTGTGWDAWTYREGDGTEGTCFVLLETGELMGQLLGCSGPYYIVRDGLVDEQVSPSGEFRPMDAATRPEGARELNAVADVAADLSLDPAQLVSHTSSVEIPCPVELDLPCVGERVPRERLFTAHEPTGIPLRIEYRVLGLVVHSIEVDSIETVEGYAPDPAAVEAAAAGTGLEDVIQRQPALDG